MRTAQADAECSLTIEVCFAGDDPRSVGPPKPESGVRLSGPLPILPRISGENAGLITLFAEFDFQVRH